MPVGAYAGANVSIGNGVTTLFAYNFKILDQAHIEVKVDGVLKVLGADYTVTGVGLSNGGNVVFGAAPANGAVVQRARKVPYTRAQDYQVNGDFKEVTVDTDLDSIEMQVQQLSADAARSFKAPLSVTADQVITDAQWTARAGRVFGFDALGNFILLVAQAGTSLVDLAAAAGASLIGFVQSGAAAIYGFATRTMQAKAAEWLSVKDFKNADGTTVTGDGVHDDTTGMQAALTWAGGAFGGENGRGLYWPTGIYKQTADLTITGSGVKMFTDGVVRFTGDGINAGYMLRVGGNPVAPIYNVDIIGRFIFYRGVTNVAGGCIEWSYAHYGSIRGARFYNGFAPLFVHDTTGMMVDDLGWFETIAGGIGAGAYLARFHTCAQLVIRKLMNFASFATKANTKVIVDFNCDDVKLSECTVGQINLTRTGGGGTFAPRWVSIDKCYGESNYEIAAFNLDNCKSVKLTSSTGNAGLVGVSVNTNALGVNISKCTFLENQQDGILIQGGSYIQIVDNDISSNNKAAGASFSGIRFSANADHVQIRKNRIRNHLSTSYTHAYGILTTGGGVISNLTVAGDNDIANFVTAAFTDNAGATSKNSRAWVPTVAGAAVVVNDAKYSAGGELLLLTFDLTWPVTADATPVTIAGMAGIPGAPAANSGAFVSGYTTYANDIHGVAGAAGIALYNKGGNPATALTNADLSGLRVIGSCVFHI